MVGAKCGTMVDETTMNRRNASTPSPPNGIAKDIGELTRGIVSLAELQFELFRIDCREGLIRMLAPVATLLVAGIVAVGTAPIALIVTSTCLPRSAPYNNSGWWGRREFECGSASELI
jgi:hypothetical protein